MYLSRSYSRLLMTGAPLIVALLTSSTGYANFCKSQLAAVNSGVNSEAYFKREVLKMKVDYFQPKSYLTERNRKDIAGLVETEFSVKYDTRFYFTGTSKKIDTDLPFQIDPNAKGVYIFFHGSGTAQSSGKNFTGIMNNLAKLGYSAVSFDMPGHGEGPLSPKFNDANYFMKWVHSIVMDARKSGKPVFLEGHSFGPDVIAEFIARYPFALGEGGGVLSMSPAGFDRVLADWYETNTSKMKFGGEVPQNEVGGLWAVQMSEQFLWNKGKLKDPTIVNPKLKVHILSGDREEYVPAPVGGSKKTPIGPNTYDIAAAIKVFFQGADVVVEKGVGHYIFNHTDANGHNTVMRETLRVAGENIANAKKIQDEASLTGVQVSTTERLKARYSYDGNFKSFIDRYMGAKAFEKKMSNNIESISMNIESQYEVYTKAYEIKMAEYAINSPTLVVFQRANPVLMEGAKKMLKDRYSQVLTALDMFLANKTAEQVYELMSGFKHAHPEQLANYKK